MASINLIRSVECPAQNHVTIQMTGDLNHEWHGTVDDLKSPMTDAEIETTIKGLIRLLKVGRTWAQVRDLLANGYTVTI